MDFHLLILIWNVIILENLFFINIRINFMKLSFTAFIIFVTISILFTINILRADNIKIIEQPKSITECQGKHVTLSVDALSDENFKLNYQWYKDNKIIPNANSPFLNFRINQL